MGSAHNVYPGGAGGGADRRSQLSVGCLAVTNRTRGAVLWAR
jgi:hypothetical protein